MCGIAGWVGHLDANADTAIRSMVASIGHRGPDSRGHWTGPSVALGMARLSIIDISGGDQPKTAGSWQVVFNGEIYNYRALRDELRGLGDSFVGSGDSEVVAHAVARWGADVFGRLDGMYAIAAYDQDTRRLLLARDRYGEKPLYLWQRGATVAFCSEPRGLRRLAPMPEIDPDTLTRYLCLGFVPGADSIWQGITRLPPGHHAEVLDGSISITRTPIEPDDPATFPGKDPIDVLDARMRSSVTSRLVADVDVGVLLSGGIDSSLVAAHAAAAHPGIHTFSVAIQDPNRDESAHARLVADALGTTHHELPVGDQDALGVVGDLPRIFDEPFADSSAIPTVLLSRFVAQHVKVALSGDGGDEFFSGYRRHTLASRTAPRSALSPTLSRLSGRALRSWWVRPQGPWRDIWTNHTATERQYVDGLAMIPPPWLSSMGPDIAAMAPVDRVVADARAVQPESWPEEADRRLYLPDDLLVKIDRASMSCGLEVRAPFLAPEVALWAAALPSSVRGEPGAKHLSRTLARRYFGPPIADRPKQGFSVPLASWLRGSLRDLTELASNGHLTSTGVLDRRGVVSMCKALDRRFDRVASPLWTIAMFELWHEYWSSSERADEGCIAA